MRKNAWRRVLGALVVLSLVVAVPAASWAAEKVARIGYQFGILYAQAMVMRANQLVEKRLPDYKVEWFQLSGGAAMRDMVISGQADVVMVGLGPFVITWGRGLDWKTLGALTRMPMALVTYRDDIRSIRDFKATDKIVAPGLLSHQHITLMYQSKKELNDPKAMDKLIVNLPHPDAMAALLQKREITAHFASPPFQYEELRQPGMRIVLDSFDVWGPHTLILAAARQDLPTRKPELFRAVVAALEEATEVMNRSRDEAAAILSKETRVPVERMREYIGAKGNEYNTTPVGIMKVATFLKEMGAITRAPASWKDMAFENLHGLPGN